MYLGKLKEPFKLTVTKDFTPDSSFCHRLLVLLFGGFPLPTPILQEKRVILHLSCLKFSCCVWEG